MSYLANPLNNYSAYSYNIAMYMVNPKNARSIRNPNRDALIADNSQISKYNLENLDQTFVVGHDLVRNSYANRFDFRISEPNGTSFFNTIVKTAIKLGIPNHLKAYYIIEITFPARDQNNKPKVHTDKFYYLVVLTDVVASIDSGGSSYQISAIEVSSSGYSYLQGVIKTSITFRGRTVGEAVQDLTRVFNAAVVAQWELDPNSSYYDEYDIKFAEDTNWGDWKLEQLDDDLSKKGLSRVGEYIVFNLPQGTNIYEYIGYILRCTTEYKKIPTYPDGTFNSDNGGGEPATASSAKLKYTYKVIANVEDTDFDLLRNDYAKKITYVVKKHIASTLVKDATEYYEKTFNNPATQAEKIANLVQTGLLRKRYDYLFTGLNTEVIALDIKLTLTYFVMTPLAGGWVSHSLISNNDGKNASTIIEKIKSAKGKITKARNDSVASLRRNQGLSTEIDNILSEKSSAREELEKIRTGAALEDIIKSESPGYTFAADIASNSYAGGPDNDVVNNANITHAVVTANLENSADLLTIELHIKGDPYWMGKPNSFLRLQNSTEELADYEIGGNMFYLRVNLPVEENSNGRRKPTPDYTLTGVYRVISVINQFRGGLFTQYLKAVRDTTIRAELVLGKLENLPTSSGTIATPTSSLPTKLDPSVFNDPFSGPR